MLKTLAAAVLAVCLAAHARAAERETISLAGSWAFALGTRHSGADPIAIPAALPETVRLPGSTDTNGMGEPNTSKPNLNTLYRLRSYVGRAWYRRSVTIPPGWRGRSIHLFLERCHWETSVWVDGRPAGMRNSLCTPHEYDLSALLPPGQHSLLLCVDNTLKLNMGGAAHSTSEQTQTNWNGVVGRIELTSRPAAHIQALRVYPDAARRSARAVVDLAPGTAGTVTLRARVAGQETPPVTLAVPPEAVALEAQVPLGSRAPLWSEFQPTLLRMTADLRDASGRLTDHVETSFGLRTITVSADRRLLLNGRPLFLRGTLECCIFPRTGHPPAGLAAWTRIFSVCRSYGLNHMRFHSWCPPDAAFEAADRAGILLHVEAPQWVFDVGQDPPRDAFIADEVRRILSAYASHPSFVMLCMGNELAGDTAWLQKLVLLGKSLDPTRLYTPATAWSFGPNDDYNVAVVRGLRGPGTEHDFRAEIANRRAPTVSHEIAQWAVFPNLSEMPKYTGVLRARNFEIVRDALAARGMLGLASAFTRASGRLMVELYKEEIEVLLRTPNHGGFQLLDLHDFPGQGTALVGALDPFWDSKGLITPQAWRRFCAPVVPLLRIPRRVYTTGQALQGRIDIAQYGPVDLPACKPAWELRTADGRLIQRGELSPVDLPAGEMTPAGALSVSLTGVRAPARLTLTVSLPGTPWANDWHIWVYPDRPAAPAPGVLVTRELNEAARAALARGGRVLLLASGATIRKSRPGSFTPVFWSPIWISGGAGTMSILCSPNHPALAGFPTAPHTDWQWMDLLQGSRAMIIDDLPRGLPVIVRMIDNFARNHRLAEIFEARTGGGSLLVCSLGLSGDLAARPAARAMLESLTAYAASPAFQPAFPLSLEQLAPLIGPPSGLAAMLHAPGPGPAALHVVAAPMVAEPDTAEPWRPAADRVVARAPGFDYAVRGGTWRDSQGSAWHDLQDLRVEIQCPPGFAGALYVRFHDWNRQGRVAEIRFQDRLLGELGDQEEGIWLRIPVTAADTAAGRLVLSARPTAANAMISEIVLQPAH